MLLLKTLLIWLFLILSLLYIKITKLEMFHGLM